MFKWLKQWRCRHWWHDGPGYSYEHGVGAIVCGEQKQVVVTKATRSCAICGLKDERTTNVECLGWQ